MVISKIRSGISNLVDKFQKGRQANIELMKRSNLPQKTPVQLATAIAPIGRVKVIGSAGKLVTGTGKTISGVVSTIGRLPRAIKVASFFGLGYGAYQTSPTVRQAVKQFPLGFGRKVGIGIETTKDIFGGITDWLTDYKKPPTSVLTGLGGLGLGLATPTIIDAFRKGKDQQFTAPALGSTGIPLQSPIPEEKPKETAVKPMKFKNIVNVNVKQSRTKKYINPLIIRL